MVLNNLFTKVSNADSQIYSIAIENYFSLVSSAPNFLIASSTYETI